MGNRCSTSSMEGRRLAGGRASIARFAYFLGLEKTPEPFRVRSVAWVENHVEMGVGVSRAREVVFSITAPRPDEPCFVNTGKVALSYRGKEVPESLLRLIRVVAMKRMAPVTMGQAAAILAEDPELGDASLPSPVDAQARPANQLDTWGAEGVWADFFAGGEIARGQLDSIDPTKLFSFIQHCDNECLLVNPSGLAPLVSMVDYPWGDRARTIGEPPTNKRGGPGPGSDDGDPGRDDPTMKVGEMMTTELTEKDVIAGNPDKVRDILEAAVKRPNPDHKIIFFSNTCVPTVTGEDVESVVREYQRKSDVPLLYLTVTPKAMTDVFRDLLVNRRRRAEEAAPPPDPRAVNLIGFPDDKAVQELRALLARFGVRVNCQLLPDLDVERLDKLGGAALGVYRPNAVWAHYYEQLRDGSRIPWVQPQAPFGREGTRRFVETVLQRLGLEMDAAVWEAYAAPFDEAWKRLTARAAGHRLGFVVRGEELQYFTDPGQTWGVPLVEMMEEAGFGLDVMLHVVELANAKTMAEQIAPLFRHKDRHQVHGFQSLEALRALLQRTPCEAVLTHHFFDWRLSEGGKNRFNLQHFEMGLPGALRTIDRLVRICETPFYRKYARYLQRTREGLRAAPPPRADPGSEAPSAPGSPTR